MKTHPYIRGRKDNFCASPRLQSHLLEFSADQPFERGVKLLRTALPGVSAGATTAQRLMQHYGNLGEVEDLLQQPGFDGGGGEAARGEGDEADEVLYLQVDGGHLRTDDGFRETKVGRLFSSYGLQQVSSQTADIQRRCALEASDFVAQLGYYGEFTQRFEPLVAAHQAQRPAAQPVAISDGADWIAGWLAKQYPEATVILDFFHAAEKVGEYAGMIFTSSSSRTQWVDHQHQAQRDGQFDQVIEEVTNKASGRRAFIQEAAAKLVGYLDQNRYRMKYPEYRAKGYCMGSGAIESAMSTVVQQRCKLGVSGGRIKSARYSMCAAFLRAGSALSYAPSSTAEWGMPKRLKRQSGLRPYRPYDTQVRHRQF